jgi:hypothetical protein
MASVEDGYGGGAETQRKTDNIYGAIKTIPLQLAEG